MHSTVQPIATAIMKVHALHLMPAMICMTAHAPKMAAKKAFAGREGQYP